jgi:hypothetical protein
MSTLDQVTQLETEIRALEATIRERMFAILNTARREGFDLGFRAGQQAARPESETT